MKRDTFSAQRKSVSKYVIEKPKSASKRFTYTMSKAELNIIQPEGRGTSKARFIIFFLFLYCQFYSNYIQVVILEFSEKSYLIILIEKL